MELRVEPYYQAADARLFLGDVRAVLAELPEASVHMAVCSPPYWSLRDYGIQPSVWDDPGGCQHEWGATLSPASSVDHRTPDQYASRSTLGPNGSGLGGSNAASIVAIQQQSKAAGQFCQLCPAWKGCLGLEPDPESFIRHLVEVFRHVRRVLRDDGSCLINVGDSYAGSGKGPTGHNGIGDQGKRQGFTGSKQTRNRPTHISGYHDGDYDTGGTPLSAGLKAKDRVGIPEALVLALRADGWYWRCSFPWLKRNCLPEAVRDRFSIANEWVICLSKKSTYYWDPEAVRVASSPEQTAHNLRYARPYAAFDDRADTTGQPGNVNNVGLHSRPGPGGRNRRTTDAWYESLDCAIDEAERWVAHARAVRDNGGLLLAPEGEPVGISLSSEPLREEHYAAYPRALVRPLIQAATSQAGVCASCGRPWQRQVSVEFNRGSAKRQKGLDDSNGWDGWPRGYNSTTTLGWAPGCKCGHTDKRPAVVLDCFGGSGTTALVAKELGRHSVLIDLSEAYLKLAMRRLEGPLFVPEAVEAPAPVADEPRTLSMFPPEPEPAGLAGEVAGG